MAKRRRGNKKSKGTKGKKVRRTDVMGAIRRLGYRSFAKYLASRSHMTLVEMAEELGVNSAFFLNYHAKWHDDTVGAPLLQ